MTSYSVDDIKIRICGMNNQPGKTLETPVPDNPRETLKTPYGKAIEYYRTRLELSQEDFSKTCGLGRNAIGEYETGKRKKPIRDTIKKIVAGICAQGLKISIEEFDAKVAELGKVTAPSPVGKLDYTETPYTTDKAKGRRDLANIANLLPEARDALKDIRTNSEFRIVEGIGLILDRFEQFASQERPFKIDRFGETMEALDSFMQDIKKKELDNFGNQFALSDLKEKLIGFQEQLGKYYDVPHNGRVPNDWPLETLQHYSLLQELFAEIEVRKPGIQSIQDIEKRNEALDTLKDLKIQLHRNPLHLQNINTIQARLEELDRNIFKELLITSQLLLGTYAEQLAPGSIFRDDRHAPEMVVMPKGKFLMGSPDGGGADIEHPQHEVRIDYSLAVGCFATTFDEWDYYASQVSNARKPDDEGWGRGNCPVINVSWNDAQGYVRWLSEATEENYRLLSEAEWEYVCRAGTDTRYWWGNEITHEQANYDENYRKTLPVDSFAPNPWGLYNVHGNVWEWVQDHYHHTYQGFPTDGSEWEKKGGINTFRVLRGGSWLNAPRYLRSAGRDRFYPSYRFYNVGFRISRTL